MTRFTDPLSESSEPPIYTPEDAHDYLTEDGRSLYIVPSSTETGQKFIQLLSPKVDDERFLVGTWEHEFWLLFSTAETELAESIAEDLLLQIGRTGPVAVYGEDDQRVFPIQSEQTYAISNEKARRSDEGGGKEDEGDSG